MSTFEKIEKLSYASKGMFFLVKNFTKEDLKCDPCGKIYSRSTTLNFHELMKVFNAHGLALICHCWQYSSNFSTAATLFFHMKTVYEGQNIQCNICDNTMPAKKSLKHLSDPNMKKSDLMPNVWVQICSWKFNDKNSAHGNKFTFTINANIQIFAAGN